MSAKSSTRVIEDNNSLAALIIAPLFTDDCIFSITYSLSIEVPKSNAVQ